MYLFTFLRHRPVQSSRRRARLGLERLESRDLPSSSVTGALVMQIANAEYAQDGALTRKAAIDLLDTVAGTKQAVFTNGAVSFQSISKPDGKAPLSASALADLQNIAANSGAWGMTPDVADLFGKVVDYNQANEHYKGNTLLPTGELAAGDPAYQLHDLIKKWFKGDDLPKAVADCATYKEAAGTLFGPNGPQASDVAQGDVGDCYFLANLAETALQSPQTIENMFIDNGDGTYTVRFFEYDAATKTSTADYVTVNRELPVNSKGEFVYANNMFGGQQTNIHNSGNILWVALAEKAYAQLAEEGWSRASWSAQDDVNSYASINLGDNRVAGQQITGAAAAVWVNIGRTSATMQTLAADFQAGDLLTICTNVNPTDSHLDGNHVYFVRAIDTAKGTVTLTNPYTTRNDRTVTLTLDELADNTGAAAVVDV